VILLLTTMEFHPFPLLPTELRLKIWSLALHTPRAITIACRKSPMHRRTPELPRTIEAFSSTTPVAPLLHTCRESRNEAAPSYPPAFVTPRGRLFVAFAVDRVCMPDSILASVPDADLRRIRHMVLDVRDCYYFEFFNMESIVRMRALETLDLLAWKGPEYYIGTAAVRDRRYVEELVAGFEGAREANRDWVCPRVRIMNKDTGEEIGGLEGGLLPESDTLPAGLPHYFPPE
jgi:hypothetical protein